MLLSPVNIENNKFYDVPCVKRKTDGKIIPILLPAHAETENGCLYPTLEHYHIDFRFTDLKEFGYAGWLADQCSTPFYKKLKSIKTCFNSIEEEKENAFFFINRWYTKYKYATIKDNRCPHRNTQLVNACGTCPAHGLPWNLETKKLKEFKLPFYLELTKDAIHSSSNPSGIMEDNSCEIEIRTNFEGNILIMVDSNGIKCTNTTQILLKKYYKEGDIITLDAKKICG